MKIAEKYQEFLQSNFEQGTEILYGNGEDDDGVVLQLANSDNYIQALKYSNSSEYYLSIAVPTESALSILSITDRFDLIEFDIKEDEDKLPDASECLMESVDSEHALFKKETIDDLNTKNKEWYKYFNDENRLWHLVIAKLPEININSLISNSTEIFYYLQLSEINVIAEELGGNIDTDVNVIVKSRGKWQLVFKKNISSIESSCRVTGITDMNHLIASHILPWSRADHNQRIDKHNGLLLTPNADHLFDRGYISFNDNGDILVSRKVDMDILCKLGVDIEKNCGTFTEDQKKYLKKHRNLHGI